MQIIRNNSTKQWQVSFRNEQEACNIGEILQAAAFEGVGKLDKDGNKFQLSINGKGISTETNRELWMLGYALQLAFTKAEKSEAEMVEEKKKESIENNGKSKSGDEPN